MLLAWLRAISEAYSPPPVVVRSTDRSAVVVLLSTLVPASTARNQTNNNYMMGVRFTSSGSLSIVMYRTVNGASTVIKDTPVPGVTYKPGTVVHAKFQVSGQGTTTLRATIWADGAARPATPQVTLTDTTAALQTAGGTGLNAYLSGSATNGPVVLSLDNLVVTKD